LLNPHAARLPKAGEQVSLNPKLIAIQSPTHSASIPLIALVQLELRPAQVFTSSAKVRLAHAAWSDALPQSPTIIGGAIGRKILYILYPDSPPRATM
jgi:hypothetical protein